MVHQDPFKVEQYMDEYETKIDYNLGETCCYSISLNEVENLSGNHSPLSNIQNKRLTYGAIRGSDELKLEISKLYDENLISNDDIVITNGAIGANFLSIYSLIDIDDHIVVIDPTYEQLKSIPTIFKGEVTTWNLSYDNQWIPQIDELKSLIKSNTKLIIINNPNNPTGQLITNDLLLKIVEIAKKNDAYLLCDEVYRPLFHINAEYFPKSIVELYSKGISTGSLSKAFSSAGLRLGWIVSRDEKFIKDCFLRRDYNTISISMIDDILATYILQNKNFVLQRNHKLCAENIEILQNFIDKNNDEIEWIKPKAGSTCFIKLKAISNTYDFAVDLAINHRTLVVPGEVFNFPGFLRIGFGNSTEELIKGLEILEEKLKNY